MSAAELTPWFPADLQPVREGVYQRLTKQGNVWHSAYRHARWWPCTAFDADTAADYADRETEGNDLDEREMPWRGLASNPKESA